MNTPDNQTPAKLSISEIVAGIKELAGFTSDFIKVSSDTFATEFPFDFVSDGALKINLCNTCRRMMLVKLGFFGTEEGSFDEFSRNIHILFEGLVNVWLKQHYFSNTLIIDFVKNYTAIKTENFFRNYAPANRPKVDIYTRFQNEIIANSLLLEQFYDDY